MIDVDSVLKRFERSNDAEYKENIFARQLGISHHGGLQNDAK